MTDSMTLLMMMITISVSGAAYSCLVAMQAIRMRQKIYRITSVRSSAGFLVWLFYKIQSWWAAIRRALSWAIERPAEAVRDQFLTTGQAKAAEAAQEAPEAPQLRWLQQHPTRDMLLMAQERGIYEWVAATKRDATEPIETGSMPAAQLDVDWIPTLRWRRDCSRCGWDGDPTITAEDGSHPVIRVRPCGDHGGPEHWTFDEALDSTGVITSWSGPAVIGPREYISPSKKKHIFPGRP